MKGVPIDWVEISEAHHQKDKYQHILYDVEGFPCLFIVKEDEYGHVRKIEKVSPLLGNPGPDFYNIYIQHYEKHKHLF